MPHFTYGPGELDHLRRRDPVLGQAIDEIGPIEREVIPDPFTALIHTVVAQQLSSRAATAIWRRLQARLGSISPKGSPPSPLTNSGSAASPHARRGTSGRLARP